MKNVKYNYDKSGRLDCDTFDETVEETWSSISSQGLLRYDQPRTNEHAKYVTRGHFKFVFQFLKNRASLRRGRVQVLSSL